MKYFEDICRMSQKQLKEHLTKCLEKHYNDVDSRNGFIYAKGTFPVLLVAHMDTVHKDKVKHIVKSANGNELSSPQGIGGDDRCGIYMILEIIKDYDCSVLFTEDEEIGCVGASKFVDALKYKEIDFAQVNYMIELDRKGSDDAVFYECANQDFEDFILQDKDWRLNYGTFTDIVELEPNIGVAGVNLSCGYYNAHTLKEYVVISEMIENINKVKKILARTDKDVVFEYVEDEYNNSIDNWWRYCDTKPNASITFEDKLYYIAAEGKGGRYIEQELYACNELEAIGQFMMHHPNVCYNDLLDIFCEE